MIDFQAIRSRHLLVFRRYAAFRDMNLGPTRRASAEIEAIKNLTLIVKRQLDNRASFLPAELIGRNIDVSF
ncbi:MAG: hypothetical protein A3F83_08900 [Candidatus Glassbacteria bacterium RIFCSPLOWO2_12_FULL_58_11]|uniref:Uncharacterized protein n=1 Tax=Candidatus Glassbacteria bacterium RIFCSPLOWO2_12_FULL_58_11 TaxID=1817867 RepID=A0A1F5YU81_9BACT|nr:MAG: hypothetical protein A3F83_08900 [Candidatus Glassbacteria bacterium RIFCSPLOWO2_12_FULL_58_11]